MTQLSDVDLTNSEIKRNVHGWYYIAVWPDQWGYFDTRKAAEAMLASVDPTR